MVTIGLEEFQLARNALKGKILHTPLLPFPFLKTQQGHPIYLKAENLQPSGSFKIRGATFCISKLPPETTQVVAYSTGNHAQAVALAARQYGRKATIVMSPETLAFKIAATQALGAEVVIVPASERKKYAEELAASTGAYLIPPFDHPDIITGQGTIGLEIIEAVVPAAIVVPLGGGGLIAGIAAAVKQLYPSVKLIGVEPELENDGWRSFHSGTLATMAGPSNSVADAVKIPCLGELTFPLIRDYVDDVITVSEIATIAATKMLLESAHLVAEPSGALALAGALFYPFSGSPDKPVVCILSGGNTTLSLLSKL
ncbi:MAG: threonine/serine dehydratase [Parachlamydiaceae bacterium]|nr:threonine/serine dehydratase [Parachlamydiaceae bacterium]